MNDPVQLLRRLVTHLCYENSLIRTMKSLSIFEVKASDMRRSSCTFNGSISMNGKKDDQIAMNW